MFSPSGKPESTVDFSRDILRCQHIKVSGVQCGSPALQGKRLCYFHSRIHNVRAANNLPVLEDANSIQCALMQIARALLDKSIDHKTAGLLLYTMQTASANFRRVNFEPLAYNIVRALPELQHPEVQFEDAEHEAVQKEHEAGQMQGADLIRQSAAPPARKLKKPARRATLRPMRPKSVPSKLAPSLMASQLA
jgi:hypothetical protein